ncbi:MAG: hypothetical protein ACI90V_003597 [Bacillariaceae sp.]|jgi:hypothetical protein
MSALIKREGERERERERDRTYHIGDTDLNSQLERVIQYIHIYQYLKKIL